MKTMCVDAELFYLAAKFVAHPKRCMSHIEGVHFHHVEGSVHLVATDGHRLIIFEDTSSPPEFFDITIRPEKGLLAACKPGRYSSTLTVSEDGTVTVSSLGKITYISPGSLRIEGVFPSYMNVIPKSISRTDLSEAQAYKPVSFGVEASYVSDFGLGKSGLILTLSGDSLAPIVVTHSEYPNMIGILMPMNTGDALPNLDRWHSQTKEEVSDEGSVVS